MERREGLVRAAVILVGAALLVLLSSDVALAGDGPFSAFRGLGKTVYGWMVVIVVPIALVVGGIGLLKYLVLDIFRTGRGVRSRGSRSHAQGMRMMVGSLIVVAAMLFWGALLGFAEVTGSNVNDEICKAMVINPGGAGCTK